MKSDSKKDKDELAKLRVAAKEGLEAMEKVGELKKRDKELSEENKTLAENFNSERVREKEECKIYSSFSIVRTLRIKYLFELRSFQLREI